MQNRLGLQTSVAVESLEGSHSGRGPPEKRAVSAPRWAHQPEAPVPGTGAHLTPGSENQWRFHLPGQDARLLHLSTPNKGTGQKIYL